MYPGGPFGPNPFFPGLQFGMFLALIGGIIAISLAIHIVICALLYGCYNRVPQQFRKQDSGLVWLLLIPCFNLVWNFFVYPQLADSYKAYFASVGRTDVGDCGRGIGLAYAICAACSVVPCVGGLAGLAALVLLIIYLVKVIDLKGRIPPQSAT